MSKQEPKNSTEGCQLDPATPRPLSSIGPKIKIPITKNHDKQSRYPQKSIGAFM